MEDYDNGLLLVKFASRRRWTKTLLPKHRGPFQVMDKMDSIYTIEDLVSGSGSLHTSTTFARSSTLGKQVTEKPVDFVGFDNVVEFNKNRQNDDNVVKAYKDLFS